MAEIVPADEWGVTEAARRLARGDLVAFPTETVYGLGADTFNVAALDHVYAAKGRPDTNPLIAHVLDARQAWGLVARWDWRCERLTRRFWPGPLTLVLPRGEGVPPRASAGLDTIAIRSPAHPVARRLLAAFDSAISAPSANRSGHVSPTTARHVATDFPGEDFLILDGGPCPVGIESTVVDLSDGQARLLRPGAVTTAAMALLIGDIDDSPVMRQGASPGTSPRHYAPRAPLELVQRADLPARLRAAASRCAVLSFDPVTGAAGHRLIVMPREPDAYAARLYEALREADAAGTACILVESPPRAEGLWTAILDRLRRAAGA
jgi:L-threonylcarbamoyladenylate synthase